MDTNGALHAKHNKLIEIGVSKIQTQDQIDNKAMIPH